MVSSGAASRLLNGRAQRIWSWAILGCILLLVAAVRFRLRDMPLERDEGEFAYGGQLLLHGILPGQLLYSMKLPGTDAAYAMLIALFGQSCGGVHIGFLVVNCATIALLFLVGRALAGDIAGVVAAATYGLTSLSGDTLGTAAHATHFVVLCATAGLLLLWHAAQTRRLLQWFGGGFLLSSSVLMKHNGLVFVALGAGWLLWACVSGRLESKVAGLKAGAVFVLGLTLPLALLLLLLWRAHTIESTWFWSVTYARAYAKENPGLMLVWRSLVQRMPVALQLPFWTSFFALAVLWLPRSKRAAAVFVTGLFACCVIAVLPGLHLRPHYYVLLLPGIALLIGTLVQQATDLFHERLRVLVLLPSVAFAWFFMKGIAREHALFWQMTPIEACRSLYGFQPFPEALELGKYIRSHSAPEAQVAVLGSEPEIYFYADRRSATGFIYTYPLSEHQPYAGPMRQQMADEIKTGRPEFVVQVVTWTSWLARPGSRERILKECEFLMPANYRPVGLCDFFPDESRVQWQWLKDAKPRQSSDLVLFERTD